MEDPQLKFAIDELKNSIDRLYRRVGNWWRVFWLGMLQGAGAVVGAAVLVLLTGWLLNVIGHVPFIGDSAEGIRAVLKSTQEPSDF